MEEALMKELEELRELHRQAEHAVDLSLAEGNLALEELRNWAYLQQALEKARQAKEQVQEPALSISYPSIFTCGSIIDRIFPTEAPISTGPQISFNLATCQSNATASQCQVEPELSQSVLNKSRVRAQLILPTVAPVLTGPPIPSFNMAASTTSPMILPASTAPVPNVATVLPGPHISFNLAACQSNAKASQCQVEPELSQSMLNKSRDPAQPILPNVATVSTGPQISSNLAACQSNAKASQCQVEPELSQSVLNKSRVRARPILTCGSEYNISYPLQTTHPPGELYCIGNAGSWQSSRRESNAGGIPVL